jgi:hypothetical protein
MLTYGADERLSQRKSLLEDLWMVVQVCPYLDMLRSWG